MSSYIVTGGNRGLGRAIVSALAERVDARIVLAVRDPAAGERAAAEIGQELGSRCRAEFSIEPLDLASRSSVEAFIARWQGPIAGLVNNAGVQFENDIPFNDDGLELTFAVNHLHALRLSLGLIDRLDGGRVIWIGSGTHNPRHPTASRFGFRGERFVSIEDTASGLEGGTGKDRYATSKFLNLATTVELARRFDPARVCISCLDPGLMPGTDLARTAPAFLRLGWHYVLPLAAKLLPDASTPGRSGKAVARLLLEVERSRAHGRIFDYKLQASRYAIDRVFDAEIGRRVVEDSLALLDRTSP
jgi:NAD(P)-dependent dehydrogenase (short-subunit alcohol dehydrogenase family)